MTTNDVASLDSLLEDLVSEIVRLVDDQVFNERIIVRAPGWRLEYWLDPDTFAVDLKPDRGAGSVSELDDYQLALIYGLGFEDEGTEDHLLLREEFDYEPGEQWEEQAIRELSLLGLAILRDVLDLRPLEDYRLEIERA